MASSDHVERKAQQPLKNEKQDEAIIMMEEVPLHLLRNKNSQQQLEEYLRKEEKVKRDFELAFIGRIVAPLEAIDHGIASLKLKPPQQEEEETTPPGTIYIDPSLIATSAVQELCTLANDNNGILWTKSPIDGRDILDEQHYQQTFPSWPNSGSFSWTEGSRASAVVNMEPIRLAHELTCTNKWSKLFPSIVSEAIKIRVLFNGSSLDNPDGSLQLIYTELQATTPVVPKRSFAFLRTCKQIDESTWVVADVSIEPSGNVGYPSGCWIQGTADQGLSKVVWVEHLKVEQKTVNRTLYNRLSHIGFAFGAERWVACLERSCERKSYGMKTDILVPGLSEGHDGDSCDYEKRYVMELSQRMVCAFCLNVGPTIHGHPWSFVSGPQSWRIYATLRKSPYYDHPKEMVVVAAITIRLSQSPEFVFEILGDERRRHEWDLSGRPKGLTKVACYTTGKDPRNNISLYAIDESGSDLILQESSVNRSGSLVVWSMVKYKEFDAKEPMCLPLNTLTGFAISLQNTTSSSSNTGGGSYFTLGVQLRAFGSKPLHELEPKAMPMGFINIYIKETVRRVVHLLDKESAVQLRNQQEEDG